jgi:chemotaxis family two-component system response regulator Rcp1
MRLQDDHARTVRLLLVEDNPADVRLLREALVGWRVDVILEVAGDGEHALRVLGEAVRGERELPDLILLDLNLPRKNGAEVLAEVKSDPGLRRIPVIVLSGSAAESDVLGAYDLHANAYVRKPRDYPGLRELVSSIERFWLEHALLAR